MDDAKRWAALAYDAFDGPPHEAVRFIAHAAPRPSPRTLDVGCGTGRVTLSLVERGWPVVGVEPDDGMRERAHQRLAGRAAVVPGRLEDLDVGDGWELVVAVNGPLAYLHTRDARRAALGRLRAALAPGGVVVLDLPHMPWILRHWRPPERAVRTFEGHTITRSSTHAFDWNAATVTHRDRFELLRGDERVEVEVDHALAIVTWPQLAGELEDAGFVDVRTHRSLGELAPTPVEGPRITVVARR